MGVTLAALPVYKYLVSVSNLTKWRDVVVVILLLWIETSTSNAMLKKPLYGWSDVSMNFVFAQNMDMSYPFFTVNIVIKLQTVTVTVTVWVIYKIRSIFFFNLKIYDVSFIMFDSDIVYCRPVCVCLSVYNMSVWLSILCLLSVFLLGCMFLDFFLILFVW